ncbi:MAG TPA: SpoIIE family protein phosphatase [Gaiellaceae bacterium]|nr:SpoIIE family protein phosphatase [Gaiellaceae bacterium]
MFRRRLIGGAAIAVIALAAVSAVLAWRQYRADQHRAVSDLNARVALVAADVDTGMAGGISTLDAIAAAPSVIAGDPALMTQFFRRIEARNGRFFSAGLGWSDLRGAVRASSVPGAPNLDVSHRLYFRRAVATHKPYVSAGLVSRRTKQPTVVVAVPTFDSHGRLNGVLFGGIQLNTVGKGKQSEPLGFQGLTILDRNGQLLLAGLARPENGKLLARIEKAGTGDFEGTSGLEGGGQHVVAFAAAKLPAWTIAIDRSESALYAAPRRSLILTLASLGGAVLLILFTLSLVVRRSRRAIEAQGEQVQSWSRLTRTLTDAATPSEIANTLLDSLQSGFPDAVIVVDVESETGAEVRASSRLPGWRRVAGDAPRLRKVAALATGTPRTRSLEREKPLRELYLAYGRRLKALHSVPILDQGGAPTGSISLMTARGRLEPSEWELLGAVVDQAARALARARAFVHEHDLAVRLQRSLLPDRLPRVPGIDLAGEYLAGGTGVEVGGDWYDAVHRPDGILQLCVGDVSGRGVGAATVMGRQRNIFRAHAYDLASPAEILRRMLRHVNDDEMITTACVSIDPLAGEIAYSCAGHPPPLLYDSASGEVKRLDGASAPPLGVADAADIVETSLRLPEPGRLAMYTDGLVERRGQSIEVGIDALGEVLADDAQASSEAALAALARTIGAPSDDVALLMVAVEPIVSFELELPAEPSVLPDLRRRLRCWLARRGFEDTEAGEIVLALNEACNNAIEHGYAGAVGVLKLKGRVDGDAVHIEVSDTGRWQVAESDDERGRGILLMHSLMHNVAIDSTVRGTLVTLERRRGVPAGEPALPVVDLCRPGTGRP